MISNQRSQPPPPLLQKMDPLSIVGVVEGSLGLALQLGTAAKSLSDIAGKYKNAKLTVKDWHRTSTSSS